MKLFKSSNKAYEHLRKKWVAKNKTSKENLFQKHFNKAALGSLGGLMLLSTPNMSVPINNLENQIKTIETLSTKNSLLAAELVDKLPSEDRNLTIEEENKITELIKKDLGISVKSEMDGVRLNRTFGIIGGEQHLYRYPRDTVHAHVKDAKDWVMYGNAGIAPGLGAWGYFAPSKQQFTPDDEIKERYYLAVQTFLVPGYAENAPKYRDFFKYRKMLVVNPKNGQAVVAVVADAGPSPWTGKHLGGSPEVMHELGLATGPRKGPVLYFFVDDKDGVIPLGPVKIYD